MNTKRILVAASLTDGRDAAFERGLALARASGAELYVLHAVPANQPFSRGAPHRLERTAELRRRAEQAGVAVRTVEQHGDPAEIIELHANARDVDLIVMGADRTLGSRWLRRLSIAERVLRRTTKPTLIVPIDDDAESGFGNVVVAVDLSPASMQVVQYAVAVGSLQAGDKENVIPDERRFPGPFRQRSGPGSQADVCERGFRSIRRCVADAIGLLVCRWHRPRGVCRGQTGGAGSRASDEPQSPFCAGSASDTGNRRHRHGGRVTCVDRFGTVTMIDTMVSKR
jgi:nucleotide-binding universal stress UspA family protein